MRDVDVGLDVWNDLRQSVDAAVHSKGNAVLTAIAFYAGLWRDGNSRRCIGGIVYT